MRKGSYSDHRNHSVWSTGYKIMDACQSYQIQIWNSLSLLSRNQITAFFTPHRNSKRDRGRETCHGASGRLLSKLHSEPSNSLTASEEQSRWVWQGDDVIRTEPLIRASIRNDLTVNPRRFLTVFNFGEPDMIHPEDFGIPYHREHLKKGWRHLGGPLPPDSDLFPAKSKSRLCP